MFFFFFYLPVPFVGDARDLNFFPSHVVVVAAVAVDGGAYFAYSARASADPSLPSVGHFQNVMSLAQSEIPVIFWGWGFLLLWISPSPIFFFGFVVVVSTSDPMTEHHPENKTRRRCY